VYELISTYGMEAMPQAMEILFNEAMGVIYKRRRKAFILILLFILSCYILT
jgi:hypothetical protein